MSNKNKTGADETRRALDVAAVLDAKAEIVREGIREMAAIKDANPRFKVGVSFSDPGSILNGYREGDISFDEATRALGDHLQVRDEFIYTGTIVRLLTSAFSAKTRSEIWDVLYDTEYESDSQELNEIMACMSDEEIRAWFPEVFVEYLLAKLNLK
ncbi:MAG: hypothetical protein DRN17_06540 [Thermoplasmata archaeon]|nr:MAG: hypothetical protein DRN17_06540 [Thermoplasmata archaeon]